MSKGVINGAVRVGQTTYKAGDEEAFAAAASQGQIKHLTKKGAISGDFAGKKASKSEAPAAEAEVVEEEVETVDTEEEAPEASKKGRGQK